MSAMQIHMALDVKGFLANATKRQYRGMFRHDDGRKMTADEAKYHLLDELAKGNLFIPFGKCNNFDPKSGCLGHPIEEKA
ncbi:hypothetical protein [Cupriavidus taiwanensis]|uniref:hypothetical protein n=1 Tax=Cupriavidus taiwanensis TaxID=164546 RepID=UPI0018DC9245|nr:hypothetical protein [Cupriavidus taiwanensis]